MKTYIITPVFGKAMLFYDQLYYMKRYNLLSEDMVHVVVNDRYPITQELNDTMILDFAFAFNCEYILMPQNSGMQKAVNAAIDFIKPNDDDVIILSDIDDRANKDGYTALRDAIQSDDSIAVAALSFKGTSEKRLALKPEPKIFWGQYWIHPSVDMWHIAAYRYGWIKSIGGFGQVYPYWGGLEAYLFEKWARENKKLIYLTEHYCRNLSADPEMSLNRLYFDPEFAQYKKCIHETQYKGSFKEWLSSAVDI